MSAQIVSFKCLLKNATGQLISSSVNRDVLTLESNANLPLKGLASGLSDLKAGDKRAIHLKAEDAYGYYDPKKVILFPLNKIPDFRNVRVGQTVAIRSKTGTIRVYKVLQVHGDLVSLDGNHPLAGQDLVFEIEATEVRKATAEEIADAQNLIGDQLLH
ncbi:MAG: peptidylprolyl isomerase [Bdellovibrionia bacterium]